MKETPEEVGALKEEGHPIENSRDFRYNIKKIASVIVVLVVIIAAATVLGNRKSSRDIGFDEVKLKQELTDLVYIKYAPNSIESYNKALSEWRIAPNMADFVYWQLFGDGEIKASLTAEDTAKEFKHHFTTFGYAGNQSDNWNIIYIAFTVSNTLTSESSRVDLEFLIDSKGNIVQLQVRSL
jgi:hypothetical protein